MKNNQSELSRPGSASGNSFFNRTNSSHASNLTHLLNQPKRNESWSNQRNRPISPPMNQNSGFSFDQSRDFYSRQLYSSSPSPSPSYSSIPSPSNNSREARSFPQARSLILPRPSTITETTSSRTSCADSPPAHNEFSTQLLFDQCDADNEATTSLVEYNKNHSQHFAKSSDSINEISAKLLTIISKMKSIQEEMQSRQTLLKKRKRESIERIEDFR